MNETWRTYAELVSKEKDPSKLMDLAEKLRKALDHDLLKGGPRRSSNLPLSQETP